MCKRIWKTNRQQNAECNKSRVFTCIQVYVLNKFIESKKFVDTVKEIGNSKRKIIFKINLYKLLKDVTALRKSTKSMHYF